jgi:type IV secretion system protein VirB2
MDSGGPDSLVKATQWLEGTLLGTVATVVAVICVAVVGLMMLAGRIDFRRAVTVVLGCFVLFGARSIVSGISAMSGTDAAYPETALAASPPVEPFSTGPAARGAPAAPPPRPADPFAGAAVPAR